jgi:RNA polymerase sigma-70 factor, ECF subfamily
MTGEITVALSEQMLSEQALSEQTLPDHGTGVMPNRLGILFDAHHQRLYRLARRMSRNADDARDLVQDTFLRAARSPQSIPGTGSGEEAWLVRVLVNLCRDKWRQRATRQRLDALSEPIHPMQTADPEAAIVARSVVQHALAVLAPRRRAVIVMHELEGMSVETIAGMLGVAAVTVRWHLSRGRLQLAQVIKSQGRHSQGKTS